MVFGVSLNFDYTHCFGIFVGFGVHLGNGCTSGLGVSGLSRGSKHSLIATVVFMAVAFMAVYSINHLLGGAV
jgi:uncharacterized membrane protein YedE/YeeE